MNGRKVRFLAKQLSPSMKSECVDRFQKRSLDRSLDRSLSFILFLRKKIEEEVNIVLDDTRFFRFLRFFFFYPSVDKGQYLHIVFRNKFKHIINSRNWKSFTDGFVTLPIRFHGELNYFSYANTLFLSILLLVSQ